MDRPFRPDALLFDLDGTLADTREDIALSLNHTLARLGRPPVNLEQVTRFIGDGARQLVARALGGAENGALQAAMNIFLPHYTDHCADHLRLYPGAKSVLEMFSQKGLAVVTNKPEAATRLVLKALGIDGFIKVVIGGDTLAARKPSPEPLLEAARRLGVSPALAGMVGDSPGDIQAGKAAGMWTCAVTYGYRTAEELKAAAPHALISNLEGLQEVIS